MISDSGELCMYVVDKNTECLQHSCYVPGTCVKCSEMRREFSWRRAVSRRVPLSCYGASSVERFNHFAQYNNNNDNNHGRSRSTNQWPIRCTRSDSSERCLVRTAAHCAAYVTLGTRLVLQMGGLCYYHGRRYHDTQLQNGTRLQEDSPGGARADGASAT